MITQEQVLDALRQVYDPEFTLDIVTLNMVKDVRIQGKRVEVDLVLTTPFCPLAPMITMKVERAVKMALPEVEEVQTNILKERWEPPDILGPMEIIYPDFVNVTTPAPTGCEA